MENIPASFSALLDRKKMVFIMSDTPLRNMHYFSNKILGGQLTQHFWIMFVNAVNQQAFL